MSDNKIYETHLRELGKSDFVIAEGDSDIRGWTVKNQHGKILGNVNDLIFDTKAKKVRYLILDLAGNELFLQHRKVLLPLEVAELDEVHRNAIFPGTMAAELTSMPGYEKGKVTAKLEELVQNAFRNHSAHTAGSNKMERTVGAHGFHEPGEHRQSAPIPATGSTSHNLQGLSRQTVIGIFDSTSKAEAAAQYLLKNGFSNDNIDISYRERDNRDRENSISHFFHSMFSNEKEAKTYSDAARDGSVVTVYAVSNQEGEYAASILDEFGAANIEDKSGTAELSAHSADQRAGARKFRSRIIDHGEGDSVRWRR